MYCPVCGEEIIIVSDFDIKLVGVSNIGEAFAVIKKS